jgi:hypothetical protein
MNVICQGCGADAEVTGEHSDGYDLPLCWRCYRVYEPAVVLLDELDDEEGH